MPGNSVFRVAAVRHGHLMEGSDPVARLELGHQFASLVHDASDVVALVAGPAPEFRDLPVLRVGAAHHDLDEHLVVIGLGDRRVYDLDLESYIIISFVSSQ